jgi:hypothetical protein
LTITSIMGVMIYYFLFIYSINSITLW